MFTKYRKGCRVLFMCDKELLFVPLNAVWDIGTIHRSAVIANQAIDKMMKGQTMIVNQVNKYGRQAMIIIGELVPITDDAFLEIWNIIIAYKTCHNHLQANCSHDYTIEIDGRPLPMKVKNEDQLQEWYDYE